MEAQRKHHLDCPGIFTRSSINSKRYKIVEYIESHPGCSTRDIHEDVLLGYFRPGYYSSVLARLVYNNICTNTGSPNNTQSLGDEKANGGYYITHKGQEIIQKIKAAEVTV